MTTGSPEENPFEQPEPRSPGRRPTGPFGRGARLMAHALGAMPGAALVALAAAGSVAAAFPEASMVPLADIGAEAGAPATFHLPAGVAAAADGSVYVADAGNHRIQRFTAKGELLAIWGGGGIAPGRLEAPVAVAVAPRGVVVVADEATGRVQTFLANGTLLDSWYVPPAAGPGSPAPWAGRAPARGSAPAAAGLSVAVARDASVLVSDASSGLIYRFGPGGGIQATYGAGGDIGVPRGVAALDQDVIVADAGGGRVLRLDRRGQVVATWGNNPGKAFLTTPVGVATSAGGDVLVADSGAGRVVRFSATGEFLGEVGAGAVTRPGAVAAGPRGEVLVTDLATNQVLAFVDDSLLASWGGTDASTGLREPVGVAITADGSVLASDAARRSVRLYGPWGVLRQEWAVPGGAIPGRVAAAGGRAYLALPQEAAVLYLDPGRGFTGAVPGLGGYLSATTAVAGDPRGGFLVADGGRNLVARIGDDGSILAEWDGSQATRGPLVAPAGVDLYEGGIVVAEAGADRIRRLDAFGGEVAAWGTPGPGPGQLDEPRDVARDPADGSLLVIDAQPRLQRFTGGGKFLAMGGNDAAAGGLVEAAAVAAGPEGRGLIADPRAGRVAVLGPADSMWWVAYFANRWLAGPVAAAGRVSEAVFDWGLGAPAPGLAGDDFSMRARGWPLLVAGRYRVTLEVRGGARLWFADHLLVDAWTGGGTGKAEVEVTSPGRYPVVLEFNDVGGHAAVALSWRRLPSPARLWLPALEVSRP